MKPFIADLSTTTAANGKLEILQRKNLPSPAGWIQDSTGHISTDPHVLKKVERYYHWKVTGSMEVIKDLL